MMIALIVFILFRRCYILVVAYTVCNECVNLLNIFPRFKNQKIQNLENAKVLNGQI
jgi:hypothetical protein